MTLNKAVLYVNATDGPAAGGFTGEAEFHFETELEVRGELSKQPLIGGRGQVLNELFSAFVGGTGGDGAGGITIDVGQGDDDITLTHEAAVGESPVWGPVTTQGGSKTTNTALPAGHLPAEPPADRGFILKNVCRTLRGDSVRDSFELYIGPWSDGTYASSAGRFGRPIQVTPREVSVTNPDDDPSVAEITLTLRRVADARGGVSTVTDPVPDL